MIGHGGRHPDEGSSAFVPHEGWCAHCGRVMRVVGTRFRSIDQADGVFCSQECLHLRLEANHQAALDRRRRHPLGWDPSVSGEEISARLRRARDRDAADTSPY